MAVTNYNNRNSKRFVQDLLLSYVTGMKCNALILAGPPQSCGEYIRLINDKIARTSKAKIKSFEIDKNIWMQQDVIVSRMGKIGEKVQLYNKNVFYAEPERFIDLDLMASMKNCGVIIGSLWLRQKAMKTNKKRAFMFTVSIRGCTMEYTLSHIAIMLDTTYEYHGNKHLEHGIEHHFVPNTSSYLVRVITYKEPDGAPMLSCLITY